MITIYGIKTCSSVQKAIRFFKNNNLQYSFIDFRQTPLEDNKIDDFLKNIDLNTLFNSKGAKYRTLKLKDLNLSNEDKILWLKKENMLLKRPIIEYKDKTICAFNENIYKDIFLG